jgi:hypothetical protein
VIGFIGRRNLPIVPEHNPSVCHKPENLRIEPSDVAAATLKTREELPRSRSGMSEHGQGKLAQLSVARSFEHGIQQPCKIGLELKEACGRRRLKPFRKLLLAGVPGTGKTMLCSALASWAIEQGLLVIYISSSQKWRDDEPAATFSKIQHALDLAANSAYPTLILLEEMWMVVLIFTMH